VGTEALDKAKQARVAEGDDGGFKLLSTGVRARIVPVGATLVDEVVAGVKAPRVPLFMNEEKGREEENPLDPEYLRQVTEADRRRSQAALDAMIMFGVELEAMPANDNWLKQLQFLEKRGHLSLESFDLTDPLDREFLYKRYVAVGTKDLMEIGRKAGLGAADVEQAAATFQGKS
jgi:hypothetical protein